MVRAMFLSVVSFCGQGAVETTRSRRLLLLLTLVFTLSGATHLLHGAAPSDPLISEFAAANNAGLRDEDGAYSDWIEIYNPGLEPVSLAGWHLTTRPQNPRQWTFPDVSIPGQGFLVVFASDKNRTNPTNRLHTSFKLSRDGEYLALVKPDGMTVTSAFAPLFPPQISDVSYGVLMSSESREFVPAGAAARMFVPASEGPDPDWARPEFADASWSPVTMPVGFERPEAVANDPVDPNLVLEDVTRPGDPVEPTSFNSPANEEVDKAIDNTSATKYLNFDKLNAGFTVRPSVGPSVVVGLRLTSANDAIERDPTSFTLSGSNDGVNFTTIAQGAIPLFTARFQPVTLRFANEAAYTHYRLLFPTVRAAASAVAVQIAEVEFLGRPGAAPPKFAPFITTSLEGSMHGRSSSVYLRIPFTVAAGDPADALALRVRYDDGFVAYLNGTEVARANAPSSPRFDSAAASDRPREDAVKEERFGLANFARLLRPGLNVLAFHGLNSAASSPDFLLQARLENTRVTLGAAGYFETPTPGAPNGPISLGLTQTPVASQERGVYDAPLQVALTTPTAGAVIRYTTNGSAPTATNGLVYAGPFIVDRTTVLRAAAFRDGWRPSPVVTHTYLFLNDVMAQSRASTLAAGFPASWGTQPADYGLDTRVIGANGQDNFGGKYTREFRQALESLPAMSLVMDLNDLFGAQGIYSNPENRGDAWERAASLELIFPDRQPGFQENAGIRIQGGAFRRFDLSLKKSFRLVFRERYGASKLRFPLFGPEAASEFDNFILRANSNDAWRWGGANSLYVRDAFALESMRAMGRAASRGRFVHLYINGVYWGLYNLIERPDAAFSASYFGGEKEDWDAINQDSAPDGNYDAWNRLLALVNGNVADNAVYQRIQGNNPDGTRNPAYENLLDVENMIDYMIMNFYVGNNDWPHRNFWVGRNRDHGEGFKFYPWDTETVMNINSALNVDRTGVNNAVAVPYGRLRANADFRAKFGDHVHRHFFNGGVFHVNPASPAWNPARPQNNRPAARLAGLADPIRSAIIGETARWGDQLGSTLYTRDEHWQTALNYLLQTYLPQRSAIVLQQFRNAGLYPNLAAPSFNQHGGAVPVGFPLTMTAPAGTIYFTTDGTDPRTPVMVEESFRAVVVETNTTRRVLIPSTANGGSALGAAWRTDPAFNDAAWLAGTRGVGYDTDPTYLPYIGIDVTQPMRNNNGSAYIRIPFTVSGGQLAGVNAMTLSVRFDDGFAAFLNGQLIAAHNAPEAPAWNSFATAQNDDSAAIQFRDFDVGAFVSALRAGTNLLALHGLNVSLGSSDFLIDARLTIAAQTVRAGQTRAQVYSGPVVLADRARVKARAFNGTEWSALNEAAFAVGSPRLIISELDYHPFPPTAAELAAGHRDADDFEFIEFFNPGDATFDLGGARFVDGVEFNFDASPLRSLPPRGYVLVVRNLAAFRARHGPDALVAGIYSGGLSNSGERIAVADAAGHVIVEFTYAPRSPWPTAAFGGGPTLELIGSDLNPALPESWRASATRGGTPGGAPAATPLLIHSARLAGDELRIVFSAAPGTSYSLFGREDLGAGSWQPLQTITATLAGGETEVRITIPPGGSRRFFQLARNPAP